jgi:hypothetical protein
LVPLGSCLKDTAVVAAVGLDTRIEVGLAVFICVLEEEVFDGEGDTGSKSVEGGERRAPLSPVEVWTV